MIDENAKGLFVFDNKYNAKKMHHDNNSNPLELKELNAGKLELINY